jgi:hypothetical protein
MLWFRYYVEALNDPKVQLLSPEQFKFWVNCLCVARQNNGLLPDVAGLAFQLRMDSTKAEAAVQDLTRSGLLDRDGNILTPHNWNVRQYQSDVSTARVKRHRSKVGSGTLQKRNLPVAVASPEQNRFRLQTEQITSPFDDSLEPITIDEWIEWEAFQLWVMGSLDESRGAFPMIVKDSLEARCPGFLEAEQKRVAECINAGERYAFLSEFMPGLVGWGFRILFQLRPVQTERLPGMDFRVMVYHHDPRHARNLAYLSHLDKIRFHERLNAGEIDQYPGFEEWRDAAWAHKDDCPTCSS